VRPPAGGIPAGNPNFAATELELPRVAVAELPGGRVLGPKHAVISGRGDLVQEISYYFGTRRPREHPLFLHPFPGPPLEFDGRLGVLASRGGENYYHFLVDVLARMGVLDLAPSVAAPDRWYVPASAGWQREILGLAGLNSGDWIDSTEHPHVRASTLVVPGVPAMTVDNPAWVSGYLRSKLLPAVGIDPAAAASGPPIYVGRGSSPNNRSVLNEVDLMTMLTEHGFEQLDPASLSVSEQISAFAKAPLIVAPHGAALANIMFAPPGAAVIELMPNAAVMQNCYWTLAFGGPDFQYRYLISTGETAGGDLSTSLVQDITVDLVAMKQLLADVDRT
jgi:capsular polysaccharide biosynthesis protein